MIVRDPFWDRLRLVITALVLAVAAAALIASLSFRPLAAYFPIAAAGMVLFFAGLQFVMYLRAYMAQRPLIVQTTETVSPIHGLGLTGLLTSMRYVLWFVGFLVLMAVFGALVSAGVFVTAFIRHEAKWKWSGAVTAGILVVMAVAVMIRGLGLDAPPVALGHRLRLGLIRRWQAPVSPRPRTCVGWTERLSPQ